MASKMATKIAAVILQLPCVLHCLRQTTHKYDTVKSHSNEIRIQPIDMLFDLILLISISHSHDAHTGKMNQNRNNAIASLRYCYQSAKYGPFNIILHMYWVQCICMSIYAFCVQSIVTSFLCSLCEITILTPFVKRRNRIWYSAKLYTNHQHWGTQDRLVERIFI